MKFGLILDPRLGLDTDECAAAWNADPTLRAHAVAEAESGRPTRPGAFFDPMLAQGLINLAVSVAGGLTTNLVLDFVRAQLKAKGKDDVPPIKIEQRELSKDECRLIVRADDEGPS